MLAVLDRGFAQALRKRARDFVQGRKRNDDLATDTAERISEAYIIEETAMALYLASDYGLVDEYYPGDTGPVLGSLYRRSDSDEIMKFLGVPIHPKRFWSTALSQDGVLCRTLAWESKYGHVVAGVGEWAMQP